MVVRTRRLFATMDEDGEWKRGERESGFQRLKQQSGDDWLYGQSRYTAGG